jgi:tRNA 2-thiocytidine biosynthesis protein TtcA
VETLLMNVMHHGNVTTMAPRVSLFTGQLTVLRPLCFVREEETRAYAAAATFVPPPCVCPGTGLSVRRDTKQLLARLQAEVPDVKERLFALLGGPSSSGRCPLPAAGGEASNE